MSKFDTQTSTKSIFLRNMLNRDFPLWDEKDETEARLKRKAEVLASYLNSFENVVNISAPAGSGKSYIFSKHSGRTKVLTDFDFYGITNPIQVKELECDSGLVILDDQKTVCVNVDWRFEGFNTKNESMWLSIFETILERIMIVKASLKHELSYDIKNIVLIGYAPLFVIKRFGLLKARVHNFIFISDKVADETSSNPVKLNARNKFIGDINLLSHTNEIDTKDIIWSSNYLDDELDLILAQTGFNFTCISK